MPLLSVHSTRLRFLYLKPRFHVRYLFMIMSFRMQGYKKDLITWERLGRKYNKESLKIFRNVKNHLEKKAPKKDDLDKFGECVGCLEGLIIDFQKPFSSIWKQSSTIHFVNSTRYWLDTMRSLTRYDSLI